MDEILDKMPPEPAHERRDAREEVANKVVQLTKNTELKPLLLGIFAEYDIFPKEKSLIVMDGTQATELIQRFVVAKKVAGCTNRTCKLYYRNLTLFFDFSKTLPAQTQHTDIQRFLAKKITDGCSKVYQQNLYRTLSSFYKWMVREELIVKDPTLKVDPPKARAQKKKAFTDMDVELIRNACQNAYETALIEVMLSTACRVFEVGELTRAQVENSEIPIIGKGEKPRNVFLNAKAQVAIANFLAERKDDNPYLFPASICAEGKSLAEVKKGWYMIPEKVSANKHLDNSAIEAIVRRIGKRAGVSNCHPHRFRRTCATWALRHGMPIIIVQQMLGHSSLETTQRYLDIEDNELREAHKKFVN